MNHTVLNQRAPSKGKLLYMRYIYAYIYIYMLKMMAPTPTAQHTFRFTFSNSLMVGYVYSQTLTCLLHPYPCSNSMLFPGYLLFPGNRAV